MFQRFHAMKEERDEGFTLIELLVVILIIAILAAIAIPVFLRQREKGWIGQAESALKNAATAQESYLTSEGVYAETTAQLVSEGYKATEGVTVTVVSGGGTAQRYCLQAVHSSLPADARTYHYDSAEGRPEEGTC